MLHWIFYRSSLANISYCKGLSAGNKHQNELSEFKFAIRIIRKTLDSLSTEIRKIIKWLSSKKKKSVQHKDTSSIKDKLYPKEKAFVVLTVTSCFKIELITFRTCDTGFCEPGAHFHLWQIPICIFKDKEQSWFSSYVRTMKTAIYLISQIHSKDSSWTAESD